MISSAVIEQILDDIDIVDVIDKYVPLKKSGAEYSACCPFHTEKTASFTVSPSKQMYHCFGCGAHGDAIAFVVEQQGRDFVDVVTEFAERTGKAHLLTKASPADLAQVSRIGAMMDAVKAAADDFNRQLRAGHERIVKYLTLRQLGDEDIERFMMGAAIEKGAIIALAQQKNNLQGFLDAGLLFRREETGELVERFRNRIIFPVYDRRGRVIGFSGRHIGEPSDTIPKYLNSPESAIFTKGETLYGQFQAQAAIRKRRSAIVVEGHIDVVAMHRADFCNTVGTQGTALTEHGAKLLLGMADEVVFCFDPDAAGQKAAMRAIDMMLPMLRDGVMIKIASLPDGLDPDELVRADRIDDIEHGLKAAMPLSAYLLARTMDGLDMDVPEHAARFGKDILAKVQKIGSPLMKNAMLDMVRKRLGGSLPQDVVRSSWTNPSAGRRSGNGLQPPPPGLTGQVISLPRILLRRLLAMPELASECMDLLRGADLPQQDRLGRALADVIRELQESHALNQALDNLEITVAETVRDVLQDPLPIEDPEALRAEFRSGLKRYFESMEQADVLQILKTTRVADMSDEEKNALRDMLKNKQRAPR